MNCVLLYIIISAARLRAALVGPRSILIRTSSLTAYAFQRVKYCRRCLLWKNAVMPVRRRQFISADAVRAVSMNRKKKNFNFFTDRDCSQEKITIENVVCLLRKAALETEH